MRKIIITAVLLVSFIFSANSSFALSTIPVDLGDETLETVKIGYSGDYRRESLEYWFDQNGITNLDGSAIDPAADADQLQYELFHTDTARGYQVEFLGIGYAAYHSPFGVFTYDGNPYETFNSSLVSYHDPLFVQNEVSAGSTFDFNIEADTYFGFYLNSNNKGNKIGTMNDANSDNFDHALFFATNKGFTIAFEDIVGGGDKDYEDLVVNINPLDNSGFGTQPTPEPAALFMFGAGLIFLSGIFRKLT